MLKDLMWEIFQSTGHIGAYLAYRSCFEVGNNDDNDLNFKNKTECI